MTMIFSYPSHIEITAKSWEMAKKQLWHEISSKIADLTEKIQYTFMQQELLLSALIHPSLYHQLQVDFNAGFALVETSERLEFLGDAVINLVVSQLAFSQLSQDPEGVLSQHRCALVNGQTLAQIADKILQMKPVILMSKSEEVNERALARALEAFIGAIFLDGGFQKSFQVVEKLFMEDWNNYQLSQKSAPIFSKERLQIADFKSRLQELTVATFGVMPIYNDVQRKSLNGKTIFTVSLSVKNMQWGPIDSESKKLAQKQLAYQAYSDLNQDKEKKTHVN